MNIFLNIGALLIVAFLIGACEDPGDHEGEEPAKHEDNDHAELIDLSPQQATNVGLEISSAGLGVIDGDVVLRGEVRLNGDLVVHIPPRIDGVIKSAAKSVGDKVKKGEPLLTLDSRELAESKAEYLAANERFALSKASFDREEQLWEKKISPEQDYLEAKEIFASARIERESAMYKLQALGLPRSSIKNLREKGGGNLSRYVIKSPQDGVIVERHASIGEAVSAKDNLFVIADVSTVWVDLRVFKKDLDKVSSGAQVNISSGTGRNVDGTVLFVSPVFDTQTRTATARVVLPNEEGLWRPGLFVTARVKSSLSTSDVVVPSSAVVEIDDNRTVFLATDHGFEPVSVVTGRRDANSVEILSGLSRGDRFVSKGAFELKAKIVTGSLNAHAGHGH